MSEEIILDFDELLETRRAEKAEAIRFAKLGMGIHDSELVYAEDFEALMIRVAGPNWQAVDERHSKARRDAAEAWRRLGSCPFCNAGLIDNETHYVLCGTCNGTGKEIAA